MRKKLPTSFQAHKAVRHPGHCFPPPLPHALLLLFFRSKDFVSFLFSTPASCFSLSILCTSSSSSLSTSLPLHHHVRDHSPHYQGYVTFSSRIVIDLYQCITISPSITFFQLPRFQNKADNSSPIAMGSLQPQYTSIFFDLIPIALLNHLFCVLS